MSEPCCDPPTTALCFWRVLQEGGDNERQIRREERTLLARQAVAGMNVDELQRLTTREKTLLSRLAAQLLEAIAEAEREAA